MTLKKTKYEPPQEDDDTGLEWTEAFREKLREVVETEGPIYEARHGKRKGKVDYSFLEKNPYEASKGPEMNSVSDEERKADKYPTMSISVIGKRQRLNRLCRVAVLVLGVLVTGSGIAVWINSQQAIATKFEIQKKFYEMGNGEGFSTEEDANAATGDSINIEITDMKDIEKAKRIMPNLPVPEYIPEGYELELLRVSKHKEGVSDAEYCFKYNNKSFGIAILTIWDSENCRIKTAGKVIEEEGREICVWEDDNTQSIGCSFLIDNLDISIIGKLSYEEMIAVTINLH